MRGGDRRNRSSVNIWPGFVDALAAVLLAFVFVLLLFVVSQLYLSTQLTDRNQALESLRAELSEMADTLSMERDQRARLEEQVSGLYEELHATLSQRDEAREALELTREELEAAREQVRIGESDLEASLMEIASLQQDISALRAVRDDLESRVGELEASLDETEEEMGAIRDRNRELQARLADAQERTRLAQEKIETRDLRIRDLVAEIEDRQDAIEQEQQLTADAEARVESLRQQVQALRDQISSLAESLQIEEETVAEQQARIDTLVERLNVALAEEVEELSDYRSEFFGRLREVLGDIEEIEIVGDRFRFQSELFFETASADIGADGEARLEQVALILRRIADRIPPEIDWVLQVEGHTDRRPISTAEFPSNWELSTARAQSILYFLIDQGVPPDRLAAVGYGEYQPLAEGDDPEDLARNRRIELRLSNR
ncbi:OmpA family protein [Spiribacter vilamensis]|uniref:Chemotaxis protein MotB n=1 Tax=Spiribacter vilamensis TaxID=531306 RepID=A0A4Q8D269_9GAMM|nr:OmpA family protein [Spiribacter vilamensis]RZU99443.1 chemotaxis protein MotB [Spiribacter vilamensis]TVO61584.1 OmpA family protein [Spiribacter vilamensis]